MSNDCKEYPFDYHKRIVIKNLIGTDYRWFSFVNTVFQGIDINRCDECMIEGFTSLSMPFKFTDMPQEELRCTLLAMGLREVSYNDVELMPELTATESSYLCDHCNEDVIQFEEDMWDEES